MSGDRVNMAIPSLINGVSQQAPSFRLSSQCELQDNVLSSVVDGIGKRPPTEHMARLAYGTMENAYIHTINRDTEERYVVVVSGGNIRVFDIMNNGAEVTVNCPAGSAYLNCALPQRDLRMTTAADYTFIANKTVEVAMDSTETPEEERHQAIVYVKKGIINTSYRVMINGAWAGFTTPEPGSIVATTTSGTSKYAVVNPADWTWSECYNWLQSNKQSIPASLNPHEWTRSQLIAFIYPPGMSQGSEQFSESQLAAAVIETGNESDARLTEMMQIQPSNMVSAGTAAFFNHRGAQGLTLKNNIRQHVYNRSLALAQDGYSTSVTNTFNSDSQPSTDEIASKLASLLRITVPGFTIQTLGSCIRITHPANQDFQFCVTDSWGNEALIGIKREVQKFHDLPARCWDGVRVRVVGENPGKDDDYYLEYSSDNFYQNGVWKETRGWSQQNKFDVSTMPHVLIREANGTFTFKPAAWKERKCGDDYSVPWPSFVEGRIEDLFFYQNRLGFICDENVILSGTGEFFQFWPDTATTIQATDPIDIAVNDDEKVSLLRHAVVFGESLILFADQTQFQLGTGGNPVLSPETVKRDITTQYECSRLCRPVSASQALFFVTEQGDYSGVREYLVDPDSVTASAPEVTTHVPKYLPKEIFRMAVDVHGGMVFFVSRATPNVVYVYRYFWVGDEKVQSCWSRWILPEDAKILNIATIQSSLYLIVQHKDGVCLERIDLNSRGEEAELGYKVHLDRKIRAQGTYNPSTNTTTWSLLYMYDTPGLALVYGGGHPERSGGMLAKWTQQGSVIKAPGRHDQVKMIIGIQYEMRYRFSQQFIRESKDPGAAVMNAGRLQLLNFALAYRDSGYFQTEVQSVGRQPVVAKHFGTLGTQAFRIGKPLIESGQFKFPVLAKSDQVRIDIVNPLHYPSTFQGAEWVGLFTMDARRI